VLNLKVCSKCWHETTKVTDNCYWYNDTRVECPLKYLDEEESVERRLGFSGGPTSSMVS
jgi:hypothetical protein